MIGLLFKIWPALLPILIYFLWLLFRSLIKKTSDGSSKKKGKIIDATYQEVDNQSNNSSKNLGKVGDLSLQNQQFMMVLYLSFFVAIVCFLFFAIRVPYIEKGQYVPAHLEDGKIVSGKIYDQK